MLKEIQGGSIPKPETVQYVFQGEKKFSACYTSKKQFILVVTADDAELLAPALMLEQRGILISGCVLLLGLWQTFVFRNTNYTSVIKDYRFREPDCTAGSAKRSGTGTMCRTLWEVGRYPPQLLVVTQGSAGCGMKCLQLLNTCNIGRPSGANRSR